jgi:hypothetical protein
MTQSNKIKELLFNLRKRGVRIRQIIEITKDNVIYCKQVMEIVELRHLEHVRGGMELNDDELMVTGNPEDPQTIAYLSKDTGSSTRTNATSSPQVIYSNVKQLVEQQQFIFDPSIFKNLWKQTELNEQLKIHDKMQKELINLAAHELRTPVQPLIMSIESMKRSFPNDERISIILRSAEDCRN